jgi:hypothetical protein
LTITELRAFKRANRLIEWMSAYIGQMAPGDYGDCYSDLNLHGIFMAGLPTLGDIPRLDPSDFARLTALTTHAALVTSLGEAYPSMTIEEQNVILVDILDRVRSQNNAH